MYHSLTLNLSERNQLLDVDSLADAILILLDSIPNRSIKWDDADDITFRVSERNVWELDRVDRWDSLNPFLAERMREFIGNVWDGYTGESEAVYHTATASH